MSDFPILVPEEVLEAYQAMADKLGTDVQALMARALVKFELEARDVDYREQHCMACAHFTPNSGLTMPGQKNASDPNSGICRGMPHNVYPVPTPNGLAPMVMDRFLPLNHPACAQFKPKQ